MSEFKNFHPLAIMLYYAAAVVFSVIFINPVCMLISMLFAVVNSLIFCGTSAVKRALRGILVMALLMAAANPLFNHAGMTILCYFPNGNPLTLESLVYGCAAAFMVASVIVHFCGFNKIMTSDKLMHLTGRLIPSLSLMLSMILRFVPRLTACTHNAAEAQRCLRGNTADNGVRNKIKNGIAVVSAVTSLSLEASVDVSDSMKNRGYGLRGRTSYTNIRITPRDAVALAVMTAIAVYIIIGACRGGFGFEYFPRISARFGSLYYTTLYAAYFMFFSVPSVVGIKEEIKWKSLK